MIKLILVTFVYMLSAVSAQMSTRCFTPDEHQGTCIPFMSCTHLYDLAQKFTKNPRNRLYISLSQCGYRDEQPYVCCKQQVDLPQPQTTEPPKISNKQIPKPGECGTFYEYRLIRGNVTQLDDYPWLALLRYSKPQSETGFHCGGVLINHRYVLSSGRCVRGQSIPQSWKLTHVRLGEWNLDADVDCDDEYLYDKICSDPPIDVKIAEIIPHPLYDPSDKNQFNDIALLRLEKEVQYSDYIRPICLPFDSRIRNSLFERQKLEVAGWGKTVRSSASSNKLRAFIEGINNYQCNDAYRNEQRLIDGNSQICAGKSGESTCQNDLGYGISGPLMKINEKGSPPYFFVAGIASSDPSSCGSVGKAGIYTQVGSYIDWIQATVRP